MTRSPLTQHSGCPGAQSRDITSGPGDRPVGAHHSGVGVPPAQPRRQRIAGLGVQDDDAATPQGRFVGGRRASRGDQREARAEHIVEASTIIKQWIRAEPPVEPAR